MFFMKRIKHKNAQSSYLNRLRPLLHHPTIKTTASKETLTKNSEPQQEQLKLLTDEGKVPAERGKAQVLEEKNDKQAESILSTVTGCRRP